MNTKDFRRHVKEAASKVVPNLPTPTVDAAIAHYVNEGWTENWRASACVALARDIILPLLAKDPESKDDPIAVEFDPAVLRASYELQEMMAPEVARVRQDLWDGVSTAPFPSWKDASAWLENTFGAREERTTGENARAHRLFTDWIQDPRKAEIEGITGVQIHVEYRAHLIPYITDGICHVVVPHGSPFVALGTVARSLADATGFDPASIVMHILTDSPLVLPSIRITETHRFGRFGGGRGTVRAEFNSPDVTHAQIENVLKRVREFWGKSSKRRLTPEDERFREIINQVAHDLNLEGVPEYGKKGFFEAVRDICMDEGLGSYNNSDTGWRGPYMRWRRLADRERKLGTKEED